MIIEYLKLQFLQMNEFTTSCLTFCSRLKQGQQRQILALSEGGVHGSKSASLRI